MSDIQLNTRIAEVYEEFFVPALFAEWPQRILAAAAVGSGQRVLDVACGTGALARAAAEQVGAQGSVTGLDVNAGMLAVARQKAPAIDWRQGRAEDLPFDSDSFDAVVCQFGLMFFQDRPAALREMARVLRPGGRMAIAVWDTLAAMPGFAAVVDLLQRLFGSQAADGLRAPFSLGGMAALKAILSEAGLPDAGIVTRAGTARFPSIRSWMYTEIKGWVLADTVDDAQFEQLVAAAEQELQRFVATDGSVAFQTSAHVITAQKAA
jgi:SAM-dependent methyltransferase